MYIFAGVQLQHTSDIHTMRLAIPRQLEDQHGTAEGDITRLHQTDCI